MARLLAVMMVAVLAAGCGGIREGKEYESEAALRSAAKGYVVLGRFNDAWPMTVVSVKKAKDSIELEIPGQGRQTYPGYTGYRMQAVLLKRLDGAHAGIILRSEEK